MAVPANVSRRSGARTVGVTRGLSVILAAVWTAFLSSGCTEDAADNDLDAEARIDLAVRRDRRPPIVSITAPAQGADVAGVVGLAANATDDVGVTQVAWY